jgi:uncharacterized protein (UPF0335 family)
MIEDSVAQDQIRAFVQRILRLKDEVKAINADIREIYAEAKGNGFDKTVLGKLVNYVEKRADKPSEVAESDALFDLYLAAYDGLEIDDGYGAPRTHAHEEPEHDAEAGEITETQSPQTASDLTDPQPSGQVADIQPPVASDQHVEANTVGGLAEPAFDHDGDEANTKSAANPQADKSGEVAVLTSPAPLAKPMYAAPGVVVEENFPPVPVKRHPISAAFSDLGQDTAELNAAIYRRAGGVAEPIVKIGEVILDGWARYTKARALLIDYPVVQYAGTDLLADAINWNLASRKLSGKDIATVVGRLARLYPDREQEILGMFDAELAEPAE